MKIHVKGKICPTFQVFHNNQGPYTQILHMYVPPVQLKKIAKVSKVSW